MKHDFFKTKTNKTNCSLFFIAKISRSTTYGGYKYSLTSFYPQETAKNGSTTAKVHVSSEVDAEHNNHGRLKTLLAKPLLADMFLFVSVPLWHTHAMMFSDAL